MRKLLQSHENPIDNLIYIVVETIAPFVYKKLGLNANAVTTIANVFGVLSAYCIYKFQFILSSIFLVFAYICDCLDGYISRKYNHATAFGDYYDHISDFIRILLIFLQLYYINSILFFKVLPFIVFMCIMSSFHFSIQETIHSGNKSPSLSIFKKLFLFVDKSNAEYYVKYSRFFGSGTIMLIITLIILYYGYVYYTPLNNSIRTADEISTKLSVTELEQTPLRSANLLASANLH
jgi:phosphatidylglycerophosphate synthase